MGNDYKSKVPFDLRKQESDRIKEQYPDRLPVVVEKISTCKTLPDIDKKVFSTKRFNNCTIFVCC